MEVNAVMVWRRCGDFVVRSFSDFDCRIGCWRLVLIAMMRVGVVVRAHTGSIPLMVKALLMRKKVCWRDHDVSSLSLHGDFLMRLVGSLH